MATRVSGTAADGRDYSFLINIDHGFNTEKQIGEYLVQGRFYEPDVSALFATVLRPGDRVIDVGANVGWFSLLARALVGPEGAVTAFEPDPANIERFERNCQINGFENVRIVPQPASDKAGDVEFHLCADGTGGNSLWDPGLHPMNAHTRAVPKTLALQATTIDALHAGNVRLIKIDVEGAEERVLRGADNLLGRVRPPFVVAELHEFGLDQMGATQESLRRLMEGYGYSTFILYADGSLPMLVPAGTTIKSEYILNILFSTPGAVGARWPETYVGIPRQIHGYYTALTRDGGGR